MYDQSDEQCKYDISSHTINFLVTATLMYHRIRIRTRDQDFVMLGLLDERRGDKWLRQ